MMDENELTTKLSLLKSIKPRENWVILVRTRLMAQKDAEPYAEPRRSWVGDVFATISFLRYMGKPAYVLPLLLVLVFGGVATLQISKNSLPGDALFSVKSTIEKATMSNLELAQKRMGDLKQIAQDNKVRNLSETIKEFKASVGEVSKSVALLVDKEPGKALQAGLELVQLQKDKAAIEQILGTSFDGETAIELKNATKYLVENELEDLSARTLTDLQKQLFEEATIAYQAEDFATALEKIWSISN